jgi:hypothetical protein
MKSVLLSFLLIFPFQFSFAGYSFLLRDKRYPDRPFTVTLPSSNAEGTASFESYLVKGRVVVDEKGNPEIGIVNGDLVPGRRSSHHDWDFELDGRTLGFADMTTEVCDGQFLDIENDPDYWFHTVGNFCPWNTRALTDEIRKNGKLIFRR